MCLVFQAAYRLSVEVHMVLILTDRPTFDRFIYNFGNFLVGPAGPTTNTARLSPRYEGKTRGCRCSH